MTTYHFNDVVVWSSAGGFIRSAANLKSVSVTDIITGLPVDVVQNGVTQSGFLLADVTGRASFTATVSDVFVDFGAGKLPLHSAEGISAGASSAASAATSATSAASAATAAAASATAAASSAATAGLDAFDLYQQQGGTDTLTDWIKNTVGLSSFSFRWTAPVPIIGDVTEVWKPSCDIELDTLWSAYSAVANQSATALTLSVLVNGTDVGIVSGTQHGPSITTGNSSADSTQPAKIRITKGASVQGKIVLMGAGTSGAVPPPAARAGSAISSSAAGTTTSLTVTLPTTAPQAGDYMLLIASSSQQPSAAPTGWTLLYAGVDGGNFEFLTIYTRNAGASETAPVLPFTSASTAAATVVAFPQVELTGPLDLTPPTTPTPTVVNGTGTSMTSPSGTTAAVANESALVIYGYRFAPSTTASTATLDGALTTIVNNGTSRTGASPNFYLGVGYRTVPTASTAIPGYAATTSTSFSRAVMVLLTLKPTSTPSAPGSYPRLDVPFRAVPTGL